MLNNLRHIGPILIPLLVFSGLLLNSEYVYGNVGPEHFSVIAILLCVISFDSILLHIKYLFLSRGKNYRVSDQNSAVFLTGDESIILKAQDVTLIELHLPPSEYDSTFGWGNGENYSYMKIFDSKKRSFIVTSLMNKDLELPQSFVSKVTKVRRWRCWPK